MITFEDQDALDRYARAVLVASVEAHVASSTAAIDAAVHPLPEKARRVLRTVVNVNNATLLSAAKLLPLPKVSR